MRLACQFFQQWSCLPSSVPSGTFSGHGWSFMSQSCKPHPAEETQNTLMPYLLAQRRGISLWVALMIRQQIFALCLENTFISLFKAVKLPPMRNFEMDGVAFPYARRLTTSLSKEQMGVGRGMPAASSRCWIWSPEWPATVPLENDRKVAMILKSGPRAMASESINVAVGSGKAGCLGSKCCHVASVLGAMPLDRRGRQAFPNNPLLAREIAVSLVIVSRVIRMNRRMIRKVNSLTFRFLRVTK